MAEILLYNECFTKTIKRLLDESVDVVCIDPPYLYLKNQVLERKFDEDFLFNECKRILKKDGFIILFGRGVSFYRWNCILNDLGFVFKEEIVWNKTYNSSPVTPINRVHETISIFSKSGKINKTFVPYTEIKTDFKSIHQDIKRIKSALNNTSEFNELINFIESGKVDYLETNRTLGQNTTVQTAMSQQSRGVKTIQAITRGMKEKSIITINRQHFKSIHPTEKPVRLLERLLALVIPEQKPKVDITVADFFGGSFSTMEACYNLGFTGVSCEIHKEYYDLGKTRIDKLNYEPKLF